jgi:protein-L-isoaspartate(D-aspartate) O-methyltransferase
VPFQPRDLAAHQERRRRLIEQLREGGITDLALLHAFDQVPRHFFVPERFEARAYADEALPLGKGQSISRPSTHALYLQALDLGGRERVLEVGTGSGFQTALLAHMCEQIFSVELIPELAAEARSKIEALGITNVAIRAGDGSYGWRSYSPFDAILVTAGAREVPPLLIEQLKPGGKLLIPIVEDDSQALHRIVKFDDGSIDDEVIARVRFVEFQDLNNSSGEEVERW